MSHDHKYYVKIQIFLKQITTGRIFRQRVMCTKFPVHVMRICKIGFDDILSDLRVIYLDKRSNFGIPQINALCDSFVEFFFVMIKIRVLNLNELYTNCKIRGYQWLISVT